MMNLLVNLVIRYESYWEKLFNDDDGLVSSPCPRVRLQTRTRTGKTPSHFKEEPHEGSRYCLNGPDSACQVLSGVFQPDPRVHPGRPRDPTRRPTRRA